MEDRGIITHQPGCALYSAHWLRHAIAAAGRLTQEEPDRDTDRVSVESLTDTLAHFAELDNWERVTLREVAEHATLMNHERFKSLCNCGALSGDR